MAHVEGLKSKVLGAVSASAGARAGSGGGASVGAVPRTVRGDQEAVWRLACATLLSADSASSTAAHGRVRMPVALAKEDL